MHSREEEEEEEEEKDDEEERSRKNVTSYMITDTLGRENQGGNVSTSFK